MERPVFVCPHVCVIVPDIMEAFDFYQRLLGVESVRCIAQADMLIIGGTSLVVYPAAGLVRYYRGNRLVVINKTELQNAGADLTIQAPIGQVLGAL